MFLATQDELTSGPSLAAGSGADGVAGVRAPAAQSDQVAVEVVTAILEAITPILGPEARRRIVEGLTWRMGKRRRRMDRGITISRLCRHYQEHACGYYRRPDRAFTSKTASIDLALRPLRKRFGRSRVADFGPRKLMEVCEAMIALGWCRKHINQQIGRIKRMFKWGVENELIPASAYHSIQSVAGLLAGRSAARETEPVKPVREDWVEATLPMASPQVAAMIQLQLLTGMRPGEVCIMRTCDIDTGQQPWVYRPEHHKTEHHHHERFIFIGPKAQEIVLPFLKMDRPTAYIFSPTDAERHRRDRLHACRKTPLSCGNRPGTNRKRRPKRTPGDRYDTGSYRRAIIYACEAAFPVPEGLNEAQAKQSRRKHNWHPHQLRHNAATRLRKEFGIDVAQVVLGHKTLAVTQVHAEKNVEAAQRVMREVG